MPRGAPEVNFSWFSAYCTSFSGRSAATCRKLLPVALRRRRWAGRPGRRTAAPPVMSATCCIRAVSARAPTEIVMTGILAAAHRLASAITAALSVVVLPRRQVHDAVGHQQPSSSGRRCGRCSADRAGLWSCRPRCSCRRCNGPPDGCGQMFEISRIGLGQAVFQVARCRRNRCRSKGSRGRRCCCPAGTTGTHRPRL